MRKTVKIILFVVIIAVLSTLALIFIPHFEKKNIYKIEYKEIVEANAQKYDMDKYFIYAVIRTESNFDEKAVSKVGARGLMQIMPDAFNWVKSKMGDKRNITYDDMFTPEYNIEYCTFMYKYLLDKYKGDKKLAVAAYHSGMTSVDNWLKDKNISKDGKTIDEFPSKAANHYVNKVMKAFESYKNLYGNE